MNNKEIYNKQEISTEGMQELQNQIDDVSPVQNEKKKQKFQRLLQQYLKISHPTLDIKHCSCKHNNGCLTQLFDLTARGFAVGYATKTALNLLVLLLKKPALVAKKPYLILFALFDKQSVNFAMFPCIYNLILQSVTCGLNHLRNKKLSEKQSKMLNFIDHFAAGFLAGFLALLTKPKSSRAIWGVFLLTRAFECCYNSLINKKYIPDSQFNWIFMFSLMWINQGYNIAMEPFNCPPPFTKFISTCMNQDKGDYTLNIAWMKKKNMELKNYYGDFVQEQDPLKYLKPPTKQVNLFGFKE